MVATLDHFEIPTENSARLAEFLTTVFGWASAETVDFEGARYRRLVAGSPAGETPRPTHVGLLEGGRRRLERPVPVVRLEGEELESCLERVVAAGGRVTVSPEAVGSSGRFARFTDPDGNSWGLWQRVGKR